MKKSTLSKHPVVSQDAWVKARRKLLEKEKKLTLLKDDVAALRRELPWVRVEKPYVFRSPRKTLGLADLFDGRSQLVVYHFMLGPGWEEGCAHCSFVADHLAATEVHLKNIDITLCAVSLAPIEEITPFKKRMGWTFPWVSSSECDFNFDFGVSFDKKALKAGPVEYNFSPVKLKSEEMPGLSVFIKNESGVYRTYSTYFRGLDILLGSYNVIEMTPKGRDEEEPMDWVSYHDRYEHAPSAI
jgi:predicted dithiol-disulfide oxidoreductase (DUF899 family)